MGRVQDFAQAAEYVHRIGDLVLCKERLRQVVEGEAAFIAKERNTDRVPAAWTVSQMAVAAQGTHRGYVGGTE